MNPMLNLIKTQEKVLNPLVDSLPLCLVVALFNNTHDKLVSQWT